MITILDKLFTNSKYLFQPLTSPERITTSIRFDSICRTIASFYGVPLTAKRCYLYWKLFCWMSFFINYATISSLSAYIYVRIQQLWSCFDFGLKWVIKNIEILLLHYKVCNSGIIKMKWKGSLNFTVQLIPNQSICDVKYWI